MGKEQRRMRTFLPEPSGSPQVRRVLNPTWTKCRLHVRHVVNSGALDEDKEDALRKVSFCVSRFIIVCPGNSMRQKEPCPFLVVEISCLSFFGIPNGGYSGKTTISNVDWIGSCLNAGMNAKFLYTNV
jgi:hypothetical protein